MPTTFSTAFPARATITRPVKAGEMCKKVMAVVKADTNQSETNADPTPAPTNTTSVSAIGQTCAETACSLDSVIGSPCRELEMLAINTTSRITAQEILSPSSCPAADVCNLAG